MSKLLMVVAVLLLATGCGTSAPPSPPPDLRESIVDFGGFGPFRVGMTLTEVRKANAGKLKESTRGNGCVSFIDTDATADLAGALQLLVIRDHGDRLVGIRAPIVARTAKDIGIGSTHADITAAYSGVSVTDTESQAGPVVLVQKPGTDDYLGFPLDGDSVTATLIGTHDFAAGYELCSG